MESLRVIAWDDPRCVEPLEAASKMWQQKKGISLEILKRPLTAFNDQPLQEIANACDVMIIDHPHVPQAAGQGIILPLDKLLDKTTLSRLEEDALGSCYRSYFVEGRPYAVASDAACHVSAFKPDVLAYLNVDRPRTWDEVFELAESYPGTVGVALYHTDAFSCLLSLLAGQGAAPDGGEALFPDRQRAGAAIDLLGKLAKLVPDFCFDCTPPMLFEQALTHPKLAYIPFTFGYTRLTQVHEGNWRFGSPPVGSGSLLGGAGMAVSAQATDIEEAATFAAWYSMPDVQTYLTMNGAQPGSRTVWTTPLANKAVGHFFSDTIKTMEKAYIRPLKIWWPPAQKRCGQLLVEGLKAGWPTPKIINAMERGYRDHRPNLQENVVT